MKKLLLAAVALAALSAPAHATEWWWFNEFSADGGLVGLVEVLGGAAL
jgi:hypothetical protein